MEPLKIFWSLKAWLAATQTLTEMQADDPLRHPDINAMNLRQLADLPLPGAFHGRAPDTRAPLAKCA